MTQPSTIAVTDITQMIDPVTFIKSAVDARTVNAVAELLTKLKVVHEDAYAFDEKDPTKGWVEGQLHWYPVGGELANARSIQLADKPEFPIAERTVNAHEALIELMRRRELIANPGATPPKSPRDAVTRYFDIPTLDELPLHDGGLPPKGPLYKRARELAAKVRVKAQPVKSPEKIAGKKEASKEWCVSIEDEGIGQPPGAVHSSLLSLGASDKADKPYLIGLFGQGGSSAYRAAQYSWIVSRRAPDLLGGAEDGVGWTIIKRIAPPGIRRVYWAYLAAHPDGRVPVFPVTVAATIGLVHGTRIAHVGYDFGRFDVVLTLYRALNHLLFNPVLPYELYTGRESPDVMFGNAYRLAKAKVKSDTKESKQPGSGDVSVYRTFPEQLVEYK